MEGMMTDSSDKRLSEIFSEHGISICRKCGRVLDRGDIAWNEGQTDAGTPFTDVTIQCRCCDTGIATVWSWYPGVDNLTELIDEVLDSGRDKWRIEK